MDDRLSLLLLLLGLVGAGCQPADTPGEPPRVEGDLDPDDEGSGPVSGTTPDGGTPVAVSQGCPAIFSQTVLPTFEIEIAPDDWQALHEDAVRGEERLAAGLDPHPYRPLISFRYGDLEKRDAMIRLRGNPESWSRRKLQFQISFNEVNGDGRMKGLRKVLLDAPPQNDSFLRDRLALSVLRDMGVETPCANNARLVVNGDYYGLYTSLEKVDKEFLQRVYGKRSADGDLWKRKYWVLKTNEETGTRERLDQVIAARDPARICALVDCGAALLEWAGEAMVPNADGAWAGALNYYLYEHPTRGFIYLPWDLDATFTRLPADVDPVSYVKPGRELGRRHYDALLADPAWRRRYLDALALALDKYDVAKLRRRIDAWSEQIRDAAASDPRKPFTTERHRAAVAELRDYVGVRAAFVAGRLAEERR
jgi:hypothetical protein